MSEPKTHAVERIVNSAALKLVGWVVTAIAVPSIAYIAKNVAEDVDRIKREVIETNARWGLIELRLANLERAGVDRDAIIKLLSETSLKHTYDLQRLQERTAPRAP